ncbi:MAG: glutathione binding-like protein [Alphaproteobacteria bacterium]
MVEKKSKKKKQAKSVEQTAPIDLHFWPTPNGWKVSIFLEEAKVPYNLIPVNIGAGEQFTKRFIKLSPNNRMPAIVDPEGPDGKPIRIFESGAILQYLGRKFDRFYPEDVRKRVEVDQWLMWQMGGLGPMAGQTHHFRNYAARKIKYAIDRYTNETNRLYGVLNHRLRNRNYVAGSYSIADMAIWPWVLPYKNQGQDLDEFPHVKDWHERMSNRPAVRRAIENGLALREEISQLPRAAQSRRRTVLFGQRAINYDDLPDK